MQFDLNDDIRLLGKALGDVIADQVDTPTFELVERIRRVAVDASADPGELGELLSPLPIDSALHVIRAFNTVRSPASDIARLLLSLLAEC